MMLTSVPIFITFCYVSAQLSQTDKVDLPISPEQIRHSFDNVMSDEYIKVLAKDFAAKAAAHFMKEMSNQKAALDSKLGQIYRSPVTGYSMENLQNQLEALQKAQPKAQALSQAQVKAKAAAMVQAQMQAQHKAQIEKQAQENANDEEAAQLQDDLETKDELEEKDELEGKDEEVEDQPSKQSENQNNNNEMLDSHEALNLLKEPEPDGDHLDSQSGELSSESTREKIPVIQVMKINGAYFRRLLGLI